MAAAVRRMGCIAICKDCLRRGEIVVDRDRFGDFSLCKRCYKPVTALHERYWVLA
jgi:hypothetical protein